MNIKGLVLGAAAGALAVTGAQAADLIVEPVDYVRICDAYGNGYYFIPGTETCLRVAGRVRVDYQFFADTNQDFEFSGSRGYDSDSDRGYRFRARAYLYMDSRTATEFGLLRTFTELQAQFQDGNAIGAIDVERAFIQFGGLTFGNTSSFYNFGDAQFGSQFFIAAPASNWHTAVFAYTAAFGNGFSASISIEDSARRRRDVARFGGGDGVAVNAVANGFNRQQWIPDLVANVRVDQGWGSAQVMGALGVITGGTGINASGDFTGEETNVGVAIGGGVAVNVPFGNGTSVGIQGTYAYGLITYALADDNFYPAPLAASGFDAAGNLENTSAFSVAGGFDTSFTPDVSFTLAAGYAYIDQSEWGGSDVNTFTIDGFIGYTPVPGFVLGAGLQYRYADYSANTVGGVDDDGGWFSGVLRAQRSF